MTGILITALAAFAICTLVSEYDGPFNIFQKLRSSFKLFSCLACSSVWVSAPLAYLIGIGIVEYFAAIGLVLLLDRIAV